MPPRPRITEEMIVNAGLQLVRKSGPDKITAQAVAEILECSTQPVMSHFKRVEELRAAVMEKADRYHTEYIMDIAGENPMMEIGLRYIRFAKEEQNLFRLLFQSGSLPGASFRECLENPELRPILEIFSREAGISEADAGKAFKALFLVVHGYASMFANNGLSYDENEIAEDLCLIFDGTVSSLREKKENV